MHQNKKGVSPLIAAVLLIVFTVAVAGIVVNWLSSYAQETAAAASGSSQSVIECAKVNLDISKAYVTVNTTGDDSITAVIQNVGLSDAAIQGVTAFTTTGESCTLTGTTSIARGGTEIWTNTSGCSIYDQADCSDFDSVTLTTTCGSTDRFSNKQALGCS